MFDLMPFGTRNNSILNELNEFEKAFFAPSYIRSSFKIDIIDKKDSYVLEAELPGFEKENISVNVDGEYLTISATQTTNADNASNNSNSDKNDATYVRKERSYGAYERSFHVPNIDSNEVEAEYKNGMLKVTIPKIKKEDKTPKTISIK